MSAAMGRYVWRMIKGRIVPIRRGAIEATEKAVKKGLPAVSSSIMRKMELLKGEGYELSKKTGKLVGPYDSTKSGTELIHKFAAKTGAIRFDYNAPSLDIQRSVSTAQRKTIESLGKRFYVDHAGKRGVVSGEGYLTDQSVRKVLGQVPIFKPTKSGAIMEQRAIKMQGLTENPQQAGYILRNGEMLDFSGGSYSYRYADHREITSLIPHTRLPATSKNIHNSLDFAQARRKQINKNKHLITNLKHEGREIKKKFTDRDLWPYRKEILQKNAEKIRNLIKARRGE